MINHSTGRLFKAPISSSKLIFLNTSDDWAPEIPVGTLVEIDQRRGGLQLGAIYLWAGEWRPRLVRLTRLSGDQARIELGWERLSETDGPLIQRCLISRAISTSELYAAVIGRVIHITTNGHHTRLEAA